MVLGLITLGGMQTENAKELARDFTYIDDVVAGVLAAVDTAGSSTRSHALYRCSTQPPDLITPQPCVPCRGVDMLQMLADKKRKCKGIEIHALCKPDDGVWKHATSLRGDVSPFVCAVGCPETAWEILHAIGRNNQGLLCFA